MENHTKQTIEFDGRISLCVNEGGDIDYFFFYPKESNGTQFFYRGAYSVLIHGANTISELKGAILGHKFNS